MSAIVPVNAGEIVIKNRNEILHQQVEVSLLKIINNYNSLMTDIVYDLFIHPLNKTIYVSEKVANSLIHKSFKGVDLHEAANLSLR